MTRIIVSSCLLGRPVRHDGRGRDAHSAWLAAWQAQGRLVPLCPEMAGGLPVPRPAAEIVGGTGADVLAGRARVMAQTGEDQTDSFLTGAWAVVAMALELNCRHAILTEGSPSCGSTTIHAGRFDGSRRSGPGLTAALLASAGVAIWSENEIEALAEHLGEYHA